ncbi:MAG TPA: glycosyl hydrolase family 18 protein [Polyangiaceae bacterium]|jgi:chitinase|nr:glycosyl hydrolase family 18 protein [Polyangiaceae bacterium]
MRIEKGALAVALCLMAASTGAGCSASSDSRDNSMGAAGNGVGGASVSTGGTAAAVGGSSNGGSAGTPSGGNAAAGNAAGGNAAGGNPAGGSGGTGPTSRPKIRTVGYLPSYRGSLATWATQLDFSLVSYVNVCFGTVDDAGNVSYADTTLPAFVTAAHAAGAKVCMALGGATTISSLGSLAGQIAPANRAGFVGKITTFAMTTGLDCIDVDFEGNGVNGDYEGFVTALSASLKGQGKQTTAAVASWFGDKVTSGALQAFDFVNVMAYDLHNPGGSATPIQSSSLADAKAEIDYWVGRGVGKDKAVFGVPFYGYRWKPGATAGDAVVYSELLSTYGAAAAADEIMQAGVTIFLNGKATIVAKAQLAQQYGGIMTWELGQDATGSSSLLRAIHDAP